MEQRANHVCRTCGKEYFCCEASERQGGYKAVACSYECYQDYIRAVLMDRGESIPKEFQKQETSNIKTDKKEIETGILEKKKHHDKQTEQVKHIKKSDK